MLSAKRCIQHLKPSRKECCHYKLLPSLRSNSQISRQRKTNLILIEFLNMILEESFSLALLPRDCKIGKIVPICKRDQRLYFKLLHFVYSLSSKLLKHILPPSIASHLMLTVSFFDYQHELHKEFSCHLQLNSHMKFTSPWTKVITPMPPSSSWPPIHSI